MRRGTPQAKLMGQLLTGLRTTSMRQLALNIGVPTATVSQIEKGERALKEPKIAMWAEALHVKEEDLHELWWLSQGFVPTNAPSNRILARVFYTELDGMHLRTNGKDPHEDLTHRIVSIMLQYVNQFTVNIPVLEPVGPVLRDKRKSIEQRDLENLFQTLAGPERERVRGYIDCIIANRD